jgi:hypothetical protein
MHYVETAKLRGSLYAVSACYFLSKIRKGMPSGYDPMGENRFSLATMREHTL